MKMVVIAALAAIGSPLAVPAGAGDVDGVIRNLDLTTFPNSLGSGRWSGKATFADYGFVLVAKTANAAKLVRRADGTSKRFVVLSDDAKYMRLCFYERIVRQVGATSHSYDLTSALLVTKSRRGKWTAEQLRGGFPGCRNAPPTP